MPVASGRISADLAVMDLLINGSSQNVSYNVSCGTTQTIGVSSNGSSGLPPGYQLTVYLNDISTGVVRSQTVSVQPNGTWYAEWDVTMGCHFLDIGYTLVFQGYVELNGNTFYSPKATYNVS